VFYTYGMNDVTTGQAFKDAAQPTEKLEIAPDILEWFKKRGAFWQQEIEGVLDFYINTPYDPDAFEPGEMDPALGKCTCSQSLVNRWTFDFEGHHEHSFGGSGGREIAVALATRRMFEAGTHPSPPLAAIIAWAR
jgi:hypothetical protein